MPSETSSAPRWRWVAGSEPGTSTGRWLRTWPVSRSTPNRTCRTPALGVVTAVGVAGGAAAVGVGLGVAVAEADSAAVRPWVVATANTWPVAAS